MMARLNERPVRAFTVGFSNTQAADERVGEIDFVALIGFVRLGRKLVGARIHDEPNQVAHIKPVVDEILRQRAEQGGVRRRVGGAKVVGRINQTTAHEMEPDAVDLDPGEHRVGRTGEPVRQRLQKVVRLFDSSACSQSVGRVLTRRLVRA